MGSEQVLGSTYIVNGVGIDPASHDINSVSVSISGSGKALRDFYDSVGKWKRKSLNRVSSSVSVKLEPNGFAAIDGFINPDNTSGLRKGTKLYWSGSALCFQYKLGEAEIIRLATILRDMRLVLGEPVWGFYGILQYNPDLPVDRDLPLLEAKDVPDLQTKVESFLASYATRN